MILLKFEYDRLESKKRRVAMIKEKVIEQSIGDKPNSFESIEVVVQLYL